LKKGFITISRDLCKGCGLCVVSCPKGSIKISNKLNIKGYHPAEYMESKRSKKRKCTGCALCAITCPDVAIEVFLG
jgi:2-oxoglutarate ferredoxin oxidoreductase subunit delta